MKTLTLGILAGCIFFSMNAQITFERTYGGAVGDIGISVQQTLDGGYICAGYSEVSLFLGDVLLWKFDKNGNSVWVRTFGAANHDVGNSVQQTTDGGYIIAGTRNADNPFALGQLWLIKTNNQGNQVWQRTFGNPNEVTGHSVQQTVDGGYIITGTILNGGNNRDVLLIKTDSQGIQTWQRTFGGTGNDVGNSVQQTTDGGYIIAGGTLSFGAGNEDVYLIKTNSDGDSLWTRTFGGNNIDYASSVRQTADGGYIIAGRRGGGGQVYLVKTDTAGVETWSKTYGGTGLDLAYSVQQTTDGGFIAGAMNQSFSGGNNSDAYLIRTKSDGDTLWTRRYGGAGNEHARSVWQTTDGGFIIGGQSTVSAGGSWKLYLIKTNANGLIGSNYVWPGDANSDGIADVFDILYIGHTESEIGPARDSISVAWEGQLAVNWADTLPNGANKHHADCNGDGIIDTADIQAIAVNYRFTHDDSLHRGSIPVDTSSLAPLVHFEEITDTLTDTIISIQIYIDIPAGDTVNALAFRIRYDTLSVLVDSVALEILDTAYNRVIDYRRNISSKQYLGGTIDGGVIFLTPLTEGTKHIANFYITHGNWPAKRSGVPYTEVFTFGMERIAASRRGYISLLDTTQSSIIIHTDSLRTSIEHIHRNITEVKIFFNPIHQTMNIDLGQTEADYVKVISTLGVEIYAAQNITGKQTINASQFSKGVYIVSVKTKYGILSKKVAVQ